MEGWENPWPLRSIKSENLEALHPLSELPHPIIRRASESFDVDPSGDQHEGLIQSARPLVLFEIKNSQWRGGVWRDPDTDVHWLVAAGLAKGDHLDHDDFYEKLKRDQNKDRLLPTPGDQRLLKLETAARLVTEWELDVQSRVLSALQEVSSGGVKRFDVEVPTVNSTADRLVTVELTVVQDRSSGSIHLDELVVEFEPAPRFTASSHLRVARDVVLTALCPAPHEWALGGTWLSASTVGEPGAWRDREATLADYVRDGVLVEPVPSPYKHYTHRKNIADSTISGEAVRSLCGIAFVPARDPDPLPMCPNCEDRYGELRA